MNRSEFVFATIDTLFHPFQNYLKIANLNIIKDVPYSDIDKSNKMDIYYRESKEKLPIIVNIHGGGFVRGGKKHRKSISMLYADKGWFVLNVDYRLAPKFAFPSHIIDMFNVIAKLPELSKKYNLDLDKIVFTGDSSGAYTAATIVACLNDKGLSESLGLPKTDIRPAGLVAFCGVYDAIAALSKPMPFGLVRSIAESITGIKIKKDFSNINDFKYIKQMAPIDYVNSNWCPTCLTYAEQDFFCGGQGELMYKKLKENNVPVIETHSTHFMENHCYHFNFWTKASKRTMAVVFDFLDKIKNGAK